MSDAHRVAAERCECSRCRRAKKTSPTAGCDADLVAARRHDDLVQRRAPSRTARRTARRPGPARRSRRNARGKKPSARTSNAWRPAPSPRARRRRRRRDVVGPLGGSTCTVKCAIGVPAYAAWTRSRTPPGAATAGGSPRTTSHTPFSSRTTSPCGCRISRAIASGSAARGSVTTVRLLGRRLLL